MKLKRMAALLLGAAMVVGLAGCGDVASESTPAGAPTEAVAASETAAPTVTESAAEQAEETSELAASSAPEEQHVDYNALVQGYDVDFDALSFDSGAWSYDADNNVYYQIGVRYCAQPAAEDYETLAVVVPEDYLTGTDNGDGTYTCTVNPKGTVNGFTAETAPMMLPVNTAGYSAQASATTYSYSAVSAYLDAGYVYVYSGCRGRSNGYTDDGTLDYAGGAPWGVTDLKAAVRYLRLNGDVIPGDPERIFAFGHSGGGALSAVLGASGDSSLYFDYLASIGAAMYDAEGNYISDAICGAMCWCPITSLDYADEAYEWNMGQYMDSGTRADGTWTKALSEDLAACYGDYLNGLDLRDEEGDALTLEQSENGIYTSGSYYDYVLGQIETSLNNFLEDTEFPYTPINSMMADGGFGPPDGGAGGPPDDGGPMPWLSGDTETESVTYETPEDYIASLNESETWVEYDAETSTAHVTSIAAFARQQKNATKNVGAFDDLDRGQAENYVFGDSQNDALHFDAAMAELLERNQEKYSQYSDFDPQYVTDYQEYKDSVDDWGSDSLTRQNMYNPMYFLSDYYDGCGTSRVASHWRIHTGITQGDTALTVEMNLALALQQNDSVNDVEFQTVWGQGHTMAERTGSGETNFIAWVVECLNG